MANNTYDSFIEKLNEIFMMDQEELDFGIYRIMNYKRDEINDFLKNKLCLGIHSSKPLLNGVR